MAMENKPEQYLDYFTNTQENDFTNTVDLISYFFNEIYSKYDLSKPVIEPDFLFNYEAYLSQQELSEDCSDPKEVINGLLVYLKNSVNWINPGAMFNVTPPVNNLALAAATVSSYFNPNLAEDRSSGLFGLAEMEVVKYLSDLIGWDWKRSTGFSTFGGKGTNIFATHSAIDQLAPNAIKDGLGSIKCFYVAGEKGHPCHKEVCGLLGLGENNCLLVPSTKDGCIDLLQLELMVRQRLEEGHIFLGITVNAATTIEYIVDDIKGVVELIERIVVDFSLDYRPRVHADAVIGWPWLFFKKYDFSKNSFGWNNSTLGKIKKISQQVEAISLVDSIGVDFHKTGFCPYASSFIVVKDSASIGVIKPNIYGEYSPYKKTLELSRSGSGAFSALASLKGLGRSGYMNLIGNLVQSVGTLRTKLSSHDNVIVLDENSPGLACMFLVLPFSKSHFLEKRTTMQRDEILKIQDFNASYIDLLKINITSVPFSSFYFSSSRSYLEPGDHERWGAIKAYPMSPFLRGNQTDQIANSILESIDIFLTQYGHLWISNNSLIKISAQNSELNKFHPIF